MKQRIVGFGGRAESGKTTAAEMLIDIVKPESHEHVEFSDAILSVSQAWLNTVRAGEIEDPDGHDTVLAEILKDARPDSGGVVLDRVYLQRVLNGEVDAAITKETKTLHRPLLEWLGMRAIQLVSSTVWGDIVGERIANSRERGVELITVGGVRSSADNLIVKGALGQTVRLHRADANVVHLTEKQMGEWAADFEVDNNGTLDELHQKIEVIWREISRKDQIAL